MTLDECISMAEPTLLAPEALFLDGNSYFQALIQDIAAAQTSVELETYIFQNDYLGKRVAAALLSAKQRGADVKVLVDGVGSSHWGGSLTKQLEAAGIKTHVFHPFPWQLWQWGRAVVRLPALMKIIYFMLKMNRRNHRKVCIIDQKIAYVGSANIDQCHLAKEDGGQGWRDTGVRLLDAPLNDLQTAFDAAWNHVPIQERIQGIFQPVDVNSIFRLNNTRHRRRVLYKNLLRRVAKCKKRVWITNAYFVPDNFLLRKLNDLARKNVDVRIVLPQKSDIFLMPWASASFYENLLKSGVRIFEFTPSMLHAKTLILDDWFIVGSSNLNHRSLLHDLEVDVTIRSHEAKQLLEQQFLADLAQATEITLQDWRARTRWQKLIGRLVLYIKYWI